MGVDVGPTPAAGLIERYRDRLPVGPQTPVVSLGEGSTPLVRAPRLGAALGVDLWLKLEGLNPTGSFKDRGMTLALSKAAEDGRDRGRLRVDRQHLGVGRGLRRAGRHPLRGRRAVRQHRARQAGAGAGARRARGGDRGLVRRRPARWCATSPSEHPITLVNNLNPYRLEGQKTAAWEVVDELGGAPDWLALPVGNGGNITAWWRGFREPAGDGDGAGLPRMLGAQAAGSAAMVEGRDVERPDTVATAIRIGAPVRRTEAAAAASESGGGFVAVPDEEILDWFRRLAARGGRLLRAVERHERRRARARPRRRPGARGRARGLRAHRQRAQGPRHGAARPRSAAARARPARGHRAHRARVIA